MKIIVTGALGHIGSSLIRELPNKFPNSEIIMIDNLMTQRYCSLFELPSHGNYRFIEADVTQIDMLPIFDGAYVVVHLAAITNAAGSFEQAKQVEMNNFISLEKVADVCLKSKTRLVHLTSTSVYGTQKEVVDENCSEDELKPQSPYATIKLKEERLVCKMVKEQGLKAICCRFGTIFGISPGMRFHTAVNKFTWQAVMGQPLTVWSTAYDQKRPYLDLLDATRAITFIINKDIFSGGIYNILTRNATVRQVVETIQEFVPDLQVDFVDNKIMNQLSYEVSCKKFLNEGFNFGGDLRRGIKETVDLLRHEN